LRLRTFAAIGIAAYTVFLVATIPAAFVASRIAAATLGATEFTNVVGTAWNGSARAIVNAPGGRVAFERVEWHFAPAELAAGHIAYRVAADSPGIVVQSLVGRGMSRWIAGPTEAKIDAAKVPMFLPLLGAWHPEGTILLTSEGLRWNDDGKASGAALLTWADAAVSLSEVRPLGKYVIEMQAEDGPVNLKVSTAKGPLTVSGRGSMTPPSHITFSGEARGEGEQASGLESLLNLMGSKRADGARILELRS
jgi:general secretion pathway protein N